MIYNILLFLFVIGVGVFLFIKAMRLSLEPEGVESIKYSKEQEALNVLEELIRAEIYRNKTFEKDIEIEDVVKIDTHPNFRKKRA